MVLVPAGSGALNDPKQSKKNPAETPQDFFYQ
jgi:hypothetical protein